MTRAAGLWCHRPWVSCGLSRNSFSRSAPLSWRLALVVALCAGRETLFLLLSELWFIGILKSNGGKHSRRLRLFTNVFVQFPKTICSCKNTVPKNIK